MHCPKCASGVSVKCGFIKGVQRYKCKDCGCQYTRSPPHGKPMQTKILALVLYLSGLSIGSCRQNFRGNRSVCNEMDQAVWLCLQGGCAAREA